MAKNKRTKETLDLRRMLTGHGAGQSRQRFAPAQVIYAQGGAADAMIYVESGWVKITVVAPSGKEAVVALRGEGDFLGTRCLIGRRMGMAIALTACSVIRVTTSALIRMLREEPDFAVMFATYLVRQSVQDQENLVDQLTNSAEKRLARTLLRLADFSCGDSVRPIPARVNQTVLAEMVGTTRSRVSVFMNKFKRRGLIEYNRVGDISVREALQNTLPDG